MPLSRIGERLTRVGAAVLSLAMVAMPAAAVDLSNPAPLIMTFDETCLQGFPDTDAIARRVLAAGWIERAVRITPGVLPKGMSATNLPRFFESRGLYLSLAKPGGGMKFTSCQITTPGAMALDINVLATATATALSLGAPIAGGKRKDAAEWRRGAGQIVSASAPRLGKSRSLMLSIRLEAEPAR